MLQVEQLKVKSVCLIAVLALLLGGCSSKNHEPDDNYRVYYEIFVRSFADSNGDGIGDLKGATEKITYVRDLGATGIWLMPVMPSDSYHKYDVKDYMAIDPQYGTVEDFTDFVNKCHKNGIRVIIDMPFNHTSSQHPWFIEACDYLKGLPANSTIDSSVCPYADYYHFANNQVNGSYYNVEGTPYYYEGVFESGMPDLNLSNPAVIKEIQNICNYWQDLGIDGFRLDAVGHYDESDPEFNKSVIHDIYEYCLKKNPEFYMVSEVWEAEVVIADYYGSNTPSIFNFDLAGPEGKIIKAANGKYSAAKLVEAMTGYECDFYEGNKNAIDATFVANHDMGRIANALSSDPAAMKFAGGLNLIMQGNPFIYYGEEIGMKSKGNKDENKRLPMQWGVDDKSLMCDNPPNADPGIEQTFGDVATQIKDTESIYNYYKNAIAIRRANPAIARGTTESIADFEDGNVALFRRTYKVDSNLIFINTGEATSLNLTESDIASSNIDINSLKIVGSMVVNSTDEVSCTKGILKIPAKSIIVMK